MKLITRVGRNILFVYYCLQQLVKAFGSNSPLSRFLRAWLSGRKSLSAFMLDVKLFARLDTSHRCNESTVDGDGMFEDAMVWRQTLMAHYEDIPGNVRVHLYDAFTRWSNDSESKISWGEILDFTENKRAFIDFLRNYRRNHPDHKEFYESHPAFLLLWVARKIDGASYDR